MPWSDPSLAPVSRAAIARATGRSLASITALGVSYAVLPLEEPVDGTGITLLVVGLALFLVVLTWQVRAVLRTDAPVLRAVEALAVTIPLFLLTFAAGYVVMSHSARGSFAEPLGRVDALYFTVTVFATVGFGDIVPRSSLARLTVTAQMLCDLIVLGAVLRLLVSAVRLNRRRAAVLAQDPPGPSAARPRSSSSEDARRQPRDKGESLPQPSSGGAPDERVPSDRRPRPDR